jgi:hypothetical protein
MKRVFKAIVAAIILVSPAAPLAAGSFEDGAQGQKQGQQQGQSLLTDPKERLKVVNTLYQEALGLYPMASQAKERNAYVNDHLLEMQQGQSLLTDPKERHKVVNTLYQEALGLYPMASQAKERNAYVNDHLLEIEKGRAR